LTKPPPRALAARRCLTHRFVDVFVKAGVPPGDILRALIPNAARLLGVERARGAISAGQFADIIATPDNPLDQISTLKQVNFVMKNGKVFKSAK